MPAVKGKSWGDLGASYGQMLTDPNAGVNQVGPGERMNQKDKRHEIWLNDKVAFARQVLGRWEYKPFQIGMIKHKGIVKTNRHITMALCPRDSGKSEVGTIDDYTHEICKDPNVTGMFISESSATSSIFLQGVKSHLENNPGIKYYFGDHVPKNKSWSTEKLVSGLRTDSSVKEPTLEAIGPAGSLIGRHHHFHYYDDLVSQKNATNKTDQAKFRNWFSQTAFPAVRPGGWIKIRGTRYATNDLYGYFLEEKMFGLGCLYHIKALERLGDGSYVSYFPERYSVQDLLELKKGNPQSFLMQYQNDISAMDNALLNVGNIKLIETIPDLSKMLCFIGVDPATGRKSHHDYFATCTIAYDPQIHEIFIIRATKSKLGDPHSMLRHLNEEWNWVRGNGGEVREIRLETNGFQRAILETYYAYPQDFGLLPLVGAATDIDKILSMQQKCHWVNLGNTSMVEGNCDELLEQLAKFPNDIHEDLVDAFLRALEAMDEASYAGVAIPINIIDMTLANAAIVPMWGGWGG